MNLLEKHLEKFFIKIITFKMGTKKNKWIPRFVSQDNISAFGISGFIWKFGESKSAGEFIVGLLKTIEANYIECGNKTDLKFFGRIDHW